MGVTELSSEGWSFEAVLRDVSGSQARVVVHELQDGPARFDVGTDDGGSEPRRYRVADQLHHRCFADFATVGGSVEHIVIGERSEEHTSELQSLMRTSYAVFSMTTHYHTSLPISTEAPTALQKL